MKFISIAFLAFLFFASPASAEEQINLTAPDQAVAGTLTYKIIQLVLDMEHGRIVVRLIGSGGQRKEVLFGDADNARAMMKTLNTANLSNKSLHRRIMEKLISSGHLVGSISGTPN